MSARTSSSVLSIFLVAWTLLATASAGAQACDDGRVRVSGHCCWPGQSWSAREHLCEGVPECPRGMSEEGEGCVPRSTPASTPSAPAGTSASTVQPGIVALAPAGVVVPTVAGTSAATTDGWPELPAPQGVVDPIMLRGTDDGLVFGGLITFGVGYVVGLAMGIADAATTNCTRYGPSVNCESGPIALLPIAGATLSNSLEFNGDRRDGWRLGVGLGIPMGLAQIVGLWIFLHGIAGYTLDITPGHADLGGVATLRIDPSAPGSDAGLSAVLEF